MGELTRDGIYRNARRWYLRSDRDNPVSARLVDFCLRHAGKRMLDYGCATGDYCLRLREKGYECAGVDLNAEYVRRARERGVDAQVAGSVLPFEDNSFDTVIMFELLEHARDPGSLLREAKRVAGRNVLITVPNNSEFSLLQESRLTYEHMLELDHEQFFTEDSLRRLLNKCFSSVRVYKEEPLFAHRMFPAYLRRPLSLLIRLGILKPRAYFRLYAVAAG